MGDALKRLCEVLAVFSITAAIVYLLGYNFATSTYVSDTFIGDFSTIMYDHHEELQDVER